MPLRPWYAVFPRVQKHEAKWPGSELLGIRHQNKSLHLKLSVRCSTSVTRKGLQATSTRLHYPCVLRTLRKNNALFIEKQILICHIILITKQFQYEIYPKIILPEYCYEEIHSSPIHFNSQNVQLCLVWEKKCVFRAHFILNHFVFQPIYAIPKGGCERAAKSREAALLSSQLSISLVHLANTLKAKRGKACL